MRFHAIFMSAFLFAVLGAGCYPQTTPLNQHYGEVLAPNTVKTPAGCLAYVTAPNDTTYTIAQRFYSKGYRSYLIEAQNKDALKTIKEANGTLKKGQILFLPPDQNGRPLDSQTPGTYYWGGWK